jgi:hypothetical protein
VWGLRATTASGWPAASSHLSAFGADLANLLAHRFAGEVLAVLHRVFAVIATAPLEK